MQSKDCAEVERVVKAAHGVGDIVELHHTLDVVVGHPDTAEVDLADVQRAWDSSDAVRVQLGLGADADAC